MNQLFTNTVDKQLGRNVYDTFIISKNPITGLNFQTVLEHNY